MNRLAKWMMRLYPAAWRARYGDELDALPADSGADAKTVADLLTGGIRMRFSKGSFLKLALALGVAGMLLGLGASYLLKPQYRSTATLLMTPAPAMTAPDLTTELSQMVQREQVKVLSHTSLSSIINDPRLDLYSEERRSTPLDDVIDQMRNYIHIDHSTLPGRHSAAFTISFSYPDKFKAQQTVSALMTAFEYQNQQMQVGEQGRVQGEVLEVLDTASLPVSPVSPNRVRFALAGGLLGFLFAAVISVVRRVGHSPSAPMLATNE